MMLKKIYFALMGACIVLGSCSTGEAASAAAEQMLGSSSQALLFINCKAVSENEIDFEFSQPVTVKSLIFEPALEIASIEDGVIVRVRLEESPRPGIQFTVDMLAEDSQKNSINVLTSFRSRNNRMPSLVINELCVTASNPKTEFIELKMKSAGNLGAIRVFILGDTNVTKQTIYEFMPANVSKDDYVILHLRTREESYRDEYNGDKEESSGDNSSPNAWDFYVPGNTKLIHDSASVVYVLDQDDNVLDAVMISATHDSWWRKDYFAEAAEFLFQHDAWKSEDGTIGGPEAAVNSSATTNTRTICRNETAEDTNTADDWYITVNRGATPGRPNNPRRHN